jgi:hypothetical protein
MLDEKIIEIADEKGLTIVEENNGFSVKKSATQIRFFFNNDNREKLVTFLQEYDEEKFQKDLESKVKPKAEKSKPQREPVISQKYFEVKEVIITDIQMPFNSMVTFMVKWAIASIPAFIILMALFAVIIALFGGILDGFTR